MADIFLSYSRIDLVRATELAGALAKEGFGVWWDQRIAVGGAWDEVIEQEISTARAVVVLWSQNAVRSKWVKNEARFATTRNVLLPVMIEPTMAPIEFSHLEAADLTAWTPDKADGEFTSLLTALRSLVGDRVRSGPPPAPASAPAQRPVAAPKARTVDPLARLAHIPVPSNAATATFLMPIEDTFSISGRGIVVTGTVERGQLEVGAALEIVGLRQSQTTVATGIEMSRKLIDRAEPRDKIGVLLRGQRKEDVERGQLLVEPGSIASCSRFEAEVVLLPGVSQLVSGQHVEFCYWSAVVNATVTPLRGIEPAPRDHYAVRIEVDRPVALECGMRFVLRYGGATFAMGAVITL